MQHNRKAAAALLMLVVVIAIGMIVYFLYATAIFGPAHRRPSAPASRPWLEEDLIKPAADPIAAPKRPKPKITEPRDLTAAVARDGAPRGIMTLSLTPDGRLTGDWKCDYAHDNQHYSYEARFAGNIDPGRTYTSESGAKDKSRLYIIAKGPYTQTITGAQTNRTTTQQGEIYITGWLTPQLSAHGLITITTDRTWSITYDWQTDP